MFFSSPNAVNSVLNQISLPSNIRVAVLGEGTLNVLKSYGLKADFIGSNPNTSVVAKTFLNVLKNDRVWLPKSNKSLNRVEKAIPPLQVRSQVTYKNTSLPIKLNFEPNVIAFTSPSNVQGYLLKNKLHSKQCIVSIGETTKNYLLEHAGELKVHTADKPTLNELSRLVRVYCNE